MSKYTRSGALHEFCTLLAKALYDLGKQPFHSQKRLGELRQILIAEAKADEEWVDLVAGVDHFFRVLFPQTGPLFSIDACKGHEVLSYRVALIDDGEIRHQMDKFTNPVQAMTVAERWFYLLAWPGTTVMLLAELDSGQLIKCSERRV